MTGWRTSRSIELLSVSFMAYAPQCLRRSPVSYHHSGASLAPVELRAEVHKERTEVQYQGLRCLEGLSDVLFHQLQRKSRHRLHFYKLKKLMTLMGALPRSCVL